MQGNTARRRRRARRSRQEWQRLVELFEASGQTRRLFCGAHGVSVDSPSRWQRALSGSDAGRKDGAVVESSECDQLAQFVELQVKEEVQSFSGQSGDRPELVLRSGGPMRVEVYGEAARMVIDRVLAMMEGDAAC